MVNVLFVEDKKGWVIGGVDKEELYCFNCKKKVSTPFTYCMKRNVCFCRGCKGICVNLKEHEHHNIVGVE